MTVSNGFQSPSSGDLMKPEPESDEERVTVVEAIFGAVIQVVHLSLAVGLLLVGPALLSYVTPFSFPFRNAVFLAGLALVLIVLVVTIDVVRTWRGQTG